MTGLAERRVTVVRVVVIPAALATVPAPRAARRVMGAVDTALRAMVEDRHVEDLRAADRAEDLRGEGRRIAPQAAVEATRLRVVAGIPPVAEAVLAVEAGVGI